MKAFRRSSAAGIRELGKSGADRLSPDAREKSGQTSAQASATPVSEDPLPVDYAREFPKRNEKPRDRG